MSALVPDVALVDVRLGSGSGIETYRRVRSEHPSVRGLVLTGFDEKKSMMAAIMAGASGFLLKDIAGARLVSSVLAVARGESLLDPVEVIGLMDDVRAREARRDPREALTPQEGRILELVAAGLSNKEIAEQLFLVEKTVRNHITRILSKLGVQRRTQAALLAAGWQDVAPGDSEGHP
jgi:DNA-binding NarL/FixJ family response regulator